MNGRVAVLHQRLAPPSFDGAVKKAKPGGYADSSADIAFALRGAGVAVATPMRLPDPAYDAHWSFGDDDEGLRLALAAGADTLWVNTVLFSGHPLEALAHRVDVVGQCPAAVQRFDDKFETNRLLRAAGLPVAMSRRVRRAGPRGPGPPAVFPLMVKPVRGRGSQGVRRVRDLVELDAALHALFAEAGFGDTAMVEEALPGEEMTVTVMPPAAPRPNGGRAAGWWALPPVRRRGHRDGVIPYSGDVAVIGNSVAVAPEDERGPAVVAMLEACVAAAELVGARSPIRVDSRADASGKFLLFDLNMKPNLTGAGRPGREKHDSLTTLAARAAGWSYPELLRSMLAAAWRAPG